MTQAQALDILKTGANVFLTGEPGSGKTHVTRTFVNYLKRSKIDVAVTASTGIAATHLGGRTIHSWSGIGIKRHLTDRDVDSIASTEWVSTRIAGARVLIIDEVSMLDAVTLDAVDRVCKEVKRSAEPFGGLQTVFVGDFFQLPPVVPRPQPEQIQTGWLDESSTTGFAFHGHAWAGAQPLTCYLSEQHRQQDDGFARILSAIRNDCVSADEIEVLQTRVCHESASPEDALKLYSHNADVDRINAKALQSMAGTAHAFSMTSSGKRSLVTALKRGCLSPETLELKVGAKVMFTKNDPKGAFVNGTLGVIVTFDKDSGLPKIKTISGRRVTAEPMEWTVEDHGRVTARIGQIPLRLAWAMTVHKSQGMSLDAAMVDLRQAFVEGQGYVALSRVRTLVGLRLLGWNDVALKVHPDVLATDEQFREQSLSAEETFGNLDQEELIKMHTAFVKASGGTISDAPKQDAESHVQSYSVEVVQ